MTFNLSEANTEIRRIVFIVAGVITAITGLSVGLTNHSLGMLFILIGLGCSCLNFACLNHTICSGERK
jgi:hypothetical protein